MSPTEIGAVIVASVTTISAIASFIYAARKDASGMKNDIIATYEKRMKLMEEDIESVKKKLDEVKELLKQSENARLSAEAILQGRNPELDKYMTLSMQLLTDVHGAVMPQTVVHPTA